MRIQRLPKIFAVFIISVIVFGTTSFKNQQQFEPIAVIELFTSQGCSSCPPADKILSQTNADAKKQNRKIFLLSFHVDYWNRLGWVDPYSEKKYSQRQSYYISMLGLNGAYTPQMIVNGTTQFVGSDKSSLIDALSGALMTGAIANFKSLSVTKDEGKPIHLRYSLEGDFANSRINFALVSLSETTFIKRGENIGRSLTNENIVRQFVSVPASLSGETDFALSPLPAKNNQTIIAYVQRNSDLKIIGAAMLK